MVSAHMTATDKNVGANEIVNSLPRRPGLDPSTVPVGFVAYKVVLVEFLFRAPLLSSALVIPTVLHTRRS